MKKKSNASTDTVAATSDGPRPKRAAAITTASRYSSTRSGSLRWPRASAPIDVAAATSPSAAT